MGTGPVIDFVANGNGTHTVRVDGRNCAGISQDGDKFRVTPAKPESRIAPALLDTLPKARAYVGKALNAAAKGTPVQTTEQDVIKAKATARRTAKATTAKPATGAAAKAAREAKGQGNAPKTGRAVVNDPNGVCIVDGCDGMPRRRGMCRVHYRASLKAARAEAGIVLPAEQRRAEAKAARAAAKVAPAPVAPPAPAKRPRVTKAAADADDAPAPKPARRARKPAAPA